MAGRSSASGGFWLFIGKMSSTVILAIATIAIGRLISVDDYGLYSVSLIPAATLLLFQDWGVSPALTKYCSQYRATNKITELRRMILAGLTFGVVTGTALTIVSLLISNFIATSVFSKPDSAFLMTLVSLTILPLSVTTGIDSIFIGFDRMRLKGLTMIVQSALYCGLAPLLVYVGYGAEGAVIGYVTSIVSTFILATILLYFVIYRKLDNDKKNESTLLESLKPLLLFGIPLAISSLIGGITAQFYSFMMASYVEEMMIGNYQIASNFAVALSFLTFPITTVLFPAFSKFNPQKELQTLKRIFVTSVKYTSLFIVPTSMALMVLSESLIGTLYGDKWFYAPAFLSFAVLSGLLRLLGNLSMTNFLNGIGKTKLVLKLSILTLATGVPVGLFLIPQFGIVGYIFVSFGANIPAIFVSIYWIWKNYRIKVDYKISAKIFLASTIAALITYLFLNLLAMTDWIQLLVGFFVFLIVYIFTAPLIGAINQNDINTLRAMFSNLAMISQLIDILLWLVEKLLKLRNKKSKFEGVEPQ